MIVEELIFQKVQKGDMIFNPFIKDCSGAGIG